MPPTGRPAERRLEAVERALRVLDAFLEQPGEVGTNELSRRTGINASTVSRLLATLVAGGYVEHLPESGRYRLGLRLVELGNAALGSADLRELARPRLHELVAATGETATLSVPGEDVAITVDFVQSTRSVRSVAQLGRPSVGHATAAGKVVLAFGAAGGEPGPLERFTTRTIVEPGALADELERVRREGFARATNEREEGLAAVAVPVRGRHGELAAILGVQGPSERFRGAELSAAVLRLLDAAKALSRSLGG
jgi:DNA-binding IclR family transcriptional regulator